MKWQVMTGEQLRPHVYRRGCLVNFACKKGRADKMPKVAVDARHPYGRKTALLAGFVSAITRDSKRVKIENGAGDYGWVDVDDLLFCVEEL